MLTFDRNENTQKIYEITDIKAWELKSHHKENDTATPVQKLPELGTHPNPIVIKNPDASNVLGSTPQWPTQSPKNLRQNAIIVGKTTLQTIEDAS